MAFDISSAAPVEDESSEPKGFDLASAQPVDTEKNKHSSEEFDASVDDPERRRKFLRKQAGESLPRAIEENIVSGVTGAAASVVGGLAGLGRAAYSLASGEGMEEAARKGAETVQKTQMSGTVQPRSERGQLLQKGVETVAEVPGKVLGSVYGTLGEALGGAKGAALGQTFGEAWPSAVSAVAGGAQGLDAARKAGARVPQPVPGKDYTPLRDLTPEQTERLVRQKQQGVEPTLGSVTRDTEQVKFEEQQAKTKAGGKLRERELNNNDALIDLVKQTDTKRAGKALAENEREVGQTIYEALADKAAEKKQVVKDLYEKADAAGETKALVDVKALEAYLKKNEAEMITVPALKSVQQKLAFLKKSKKGKLTIADLENLYQSAGALSKPGDPSSKFMGDIKRTINDITEGAGGDMYKEARKARLEYGLEFEERSAIADVLAKSSRTDFKMATEDIFRKTVVNSSLDELRDVTNSLLSTDPKNSPKAWQAVREMQAQAIDYLVDESTKSIALNERGVASFSPAAYRKAMRNIGREKLDWLLGKEAVDGLYNALQTSQEIKTAPGKVSGSDTTVNAQNLAARMAREEAMRHLQEVTPGLKAITGYLRARKEDKLLRTQIDEALTPRRAPVDTIHRMKSDVLRQERQARMQDAKGAVVQAAPIAAAPLLTPDEEDQP